MLRVDQWVPSARSPERLGLTSAAAGIGKEAAIALG